MASMLRALRNRNYRLFFSGQLFSLIGTFLTMVATSWLIYLLAPKDVPGRAAEIMGLAGFAAQLPFLLVGPFGGVIADRWDSRRVLLVTQTLSMIQSGLLAWLALAKLITIPQIVVLSVFQGVVNAFDMPARQKLVVSMVSDREDLPNAIALNSSMFNGARVLGPALAGIIIAKYGVSYCFIFDAFSFLAVIGALAAMQLPHFERKDAGHSVLTEFWHGVEYAYKFQPVRVALLLTMAVSLATFAVSVLVPIFAARLSGEVAPHALAGAPSPEGVKDVGAQLFGFLQAASGIGALLGGLYLASRKSVRGLGKVIALSALVIGMGVISFGLAQHIVPALTGMFAWGFGMVLMFASINTVLQTIVDDDKRGRVMGLFGIAFMGVAPFGYLLGGMLAAHIGEMYTAVISGVVVILSGIAFFTRLPGLREIVRPIYRTKGIAGDVEA